MAYLTNAFSIQMLANLDSTVKFTVINSLPKNLKSAIGHQDTANVLGVKCNRINVKLNKGDTVYIAQLMGGRLPEGSITLPEGFTFKYIKADIS